mgnify:CR=1 FL=1
MRVVLMASLMNGRLWSALFVIVLLSGCAPTLLRPGQTYAVQWPSAQIDVVVIDSPLRDGYARCHSVDEPDPVRWVCNFNMALWWAAVDRQATGVRAVDHGPVQP